MSDLTICQGLPGSGKTTWATWWVAEYPEKRARINRDDLRRLMHGGFISGITEYQVTLVSRAAIEQLLRAGFDVVCDDTNLTDRAMDNLLGAARATGSTWQFKSFLEVPVEECVRRDGLREGSAQVGEQVIRNMWNNWNVEG